MSNTRRNLEKLFKMAFEKGDRSLAIQAMELNLVC